LDKHSEMNHLIAPSLLSADFLNLEKDIEMVNRSEADWFHLDIMDGVFVPNISFGFPVIEKINQKATKPLDVHLMIIDPDRYIQRFKEAGAYLISVHYETCQNLHRTVYAIKKTGIKAGVVLNPHSPVHLLTNIIKDVDLVMLMSVNPGYGGQKLIEETYSKIEQLKDLILEKGSSAMIEIDGGVDITNAAKLLSYGADVLVAGNTVFSSDDPVNVIHALKRI
jgi:ribulose-phosphate 3-epimerase